MMPADSKTKVEKPIGYLSCTSFYVFVFEKEVPVIYKKRKDFYFLFEIY